MPLHYERSADITCLTTEAVKEGQLVQVSGPLSGRNPQVKPAEAGKPVLGVAHDDVKAGQYVKIYLSGCVIDVLADTGLKVGDIAAAGAQGKAVKHAGEAAQVGLVLNVADNLVTLKLL